MVSPSVWSMVSATANVEHRAFPPLAWRHAPSMDFSTVRLEWHTGRSCAPSHVVGTEMVSSLVWSMVSATGNVEHCAFPPLAWRNAPSMDFSTVHTGRLCAPCHVVSTRDSLARIAAWQQHLTSVVAKRVSSAWMVETRTCCIEEVTLQPFPSAAAARGPAAVGLVRQPARDHEAKASATYQRLSCEGM